MSRQSSTDRDAIDVSQDQWAREMPDVPTTGMSVLGRARWLTVQARPAIEAVFAKHGLDTGESELFRSLMISSGGLTDRLNRLAKAGLIERPSTDGDARSLPVQLTAEGRARIERAFRDDMVVESDLLVALSEEELQLLAALLRKLSLSIEARAQTASTGERKAAAAPTT